jgi:hypothetical protein
MSNTLSQHGRIMLKFDFMQPVSLLTLGIRWNIWSSETHLQDDILWLKISSVRLSVAKFRLWIFLRKEVASEAIMGG